MNEVVGAEPGSIDLSLYPEGTRLDDAGRLIIGGCAVADLAEAYGTPALVVDEGALRRRAREYRAAFESRHPRSLVLFAAKSFPSASVVRVLTEEGCGIDSASEGELFVATAGGADPRKMVFHGNAKTDADIAAALGAGVRYIVVDNPDDVDRISRLADPDRGPVPVLLRVSPTIEASTHEALMTGHDDSKFGIPSAQVPAVIRDIQRNRRLDLRGLHAHVGSQLLDVKQFADEVAGIAEYGRFATYDLGGGLGVRYVSADLAPSVDEYASTIVSAVHKRLGDDVELIVEPGRSMVARSAVSVYRVITVKRGPRTHAAVDGGMSDNLEVALYGQPFQPSLIDRRGPSERVDIEGKHCESGDRLARDVITIRPEAGDIVVVPVTGAYTYTMSNNFNGTLRPPVVFCNEGEAQVAVARETLDDLIRRERLASTS